MNSILKSLIALFLVLFLDAQASIRMGIISDARYCGEREVGWRIKIAAESLGWEVFLDEKEGRSLRKIKDLDWVICLLPNNQFSKPRFIPHCPNYLTIFHPFNYLDEEGKLLPIYEKYDGYLLTIEPTEQFESAFQSIKKKLFYIPFYPTVQNVPYKQVSLKSLTTTLPVWSNRLLDEKYRALYASLSQSGFARFYGLREIAHLVQNGYMGELPFDGTSVINALQQHGIALIMHSDIHNREKLPSPRIFEAAAASAVIISDENPFVRKHFGDSVYYIDTSLPANEIYRQIKGYMDIVSKDPGTVLKMAEKAHQIFLDHFLMTDQLLQLESMHNKVKASRAKSRNQMIVKWLKYILFGSLSGSPSARS